jgi:ubiquinone/menaquinone biosynthesis C-methylase UbiE
VKDSYVLAVGSEGAQRLRLLGKAAWPNTRRFLQRLKPQKGWRCLDVGCGVGTVTARLAKRTGYCLGVDREAHFLASAVRRPGCEYQNLDLAALSTLSERYDLVYARYVLSHQSDPAAVLESMLQVCRPGGIVAVEDVDFAGHTWHPDCRAMGRYIDLYERLVQSRGGDPRLGRKLIALFRQAGLRDIEAQPTLTLDPTAAVAPLTLSHIGGAAVAAGLITEGELAELVMQLDRYAREPGTSVSLAPTFQVWARRPDSCQSAMRAT